MLSPTPQCSSYWKRSLQVTLDYSHQLYFMQFKRENSSISSNSVEHKYTIWPIDRRLSGATTLGPSGPGRDGNDGVLRIPQSSSITGASPSDCLVSYPGHSSGGGLTPLQKNRQCIPQPQQTGHYNNVGFTWNLL